MLAAEIITLYAHTSCHRRRILAVATDEADAIIPLPPYTHLEIARRVEYRRYALQSAWLSLVMRVRRIPHLSGLLDMFQGHVSPPFLPLAPSLPALPPP